MVDKITFYDHRNQPLKRKVLTAEPQTSRIASLHTEFENHPSRGLTPGKLAMIMQSAEQGQLLEQCHLFADIEEKDGHVYAEMGKRKRALLGLDWDIVAPNNATAAEKKAAEQVKAIISDVIELASVILDMADAIGYAYSNLEMEWEFADKEWLPYKIDHRPPSWFTVLQTDRDQLRLRNNTVDGEELQPFTWISHIHKATSGFLPRAGLHRVLAWPFLFKNYSVRDLAEFTEIYGLPLRLGTYPSGASDDEKSTLLRAVTAIGHSAAGIIPEGMMIDFKEAAKGASDPYDAMISWCERTQSKAILGGTLTSQADGASSTNALGNVHNEVRHDLLYADARLVARTLTRDLVYPICVLNSNAITSLRRCPRFVFDTEEPQDLKLFSEALPALANAGARIPVKYVNEKLKIPEPKDDEAILGPVTQPTNQPDNQLPESDALKAKHDCPHCAEAALKGGEPTVSDRLSGQLGDATQEEMTALIDQVRVLVSASESFDELTDKLSSVFNNLSIDDLARVMALAASTADLTGRFEVQEGD